MHGSYPAFGVLAGGKSSRMGTDKAQLRIGDRTFLQHILEAGRAFPERIVSFAAECDPALIEELYAANVGTCADEYVDNGPIEGIRQILRRMDGGACLITATDMPRLTGDLLRAIADQYSGSGNLAITVGGRIEPLLSIYCRECIPEIDALRDQGRRRPILLFERIPTEYIALEELGYSADLISNINSPDDYKKMIDDREDMYEQ